MFKTQPTKRSLTRSASSIVILRSGKVSGILHKMTYSFGMLRYAQRRCLIVDFDAGALHFGNVDRTTKVSLPFRDILGVAPLVSKKDAQCGSGLFCLPQIGNQEHNDFVVHTKTKCIEFRCTSAVACQKWIKTIQDAIAQSALLIVDGDSKAVHNGSITSSGVDDDSDQSTRMCSFDSSSTEDECEEDSEEHSDFDSALDFPSWKVPTSQIAKPGRCFSGNGSWKRLEKPTPDSLGLVLQCPLVLQADSARNADENKAGERRCNYENLPLRERLLARGRGPLPRDIRIP